jgi:hypothetical protein
MTNDYKRLFICIIAGVALAGWHYNNVKEQVKNSPSGKLANQLQSNLADIKKAEQASTKQFCEKVKSGVYTPVKTAEAEYKKITAEYLAAKVKTAEATKAYQLAASSSELINLQYAQSAEVTAYKYTKRDYDRITEAIQVERECSQYQ